MPPYWALGFHLCRYGYNSAENLKKVINRNRQLGIPYVSTPLLLYCSCYSFEWHLRYTVVCCCYITVGNAWL